MMKHALLEQQVMDNNMNMSVHTVLVAHGEDIDEDKQSCHRDSTPNFGRTSLLFASGTGEVHQSHGFSFDAFASPTAFRYSVGASGCLLYTSPSPRD